MQSFLRDMEFFGPWYAAWQDRGEQAPQTAGSHWPMCEYNDSAVNSQNDIMSVISELQREVQSLRGRVAEREQHVASSDSWWD